MTKTPTDINKAYLTWQALTHGPRHIVGELVRDNFGRVTFRYLAGPDLEEAKKQGFKGHTAFPLDTGKLYKENALEVFAARLPDRSRGDFKEFLSYWEIEDPNADTFTLLVLSGARLPTDNYELIASHEEFDSCEFLSDLAGIPYAEKKDRLDLPEGTPLELKRDSQNQYDSYAVSVYYHGKRLGYLKKVCSRDVAKAIERGVVVKAEVRRIVQNGIVKSVLLKIRIG
ncbi:MAG: HIRAN domain-containing protein [Elusimicrobiota bacterium]